MKPSIHSTYLKHHQGGRCYERLIKICVPPYSGDLLHENRELVPDSNNGIQYKLFSYLFA